MSIASIGLRLSDALIFCDGCGVVGVATPKYGWKRFKANKKQGIRGQENPLIVWHHHCGRCADYFQFEYDRGWE